MGDVAFVIAVAECEWSLNQELGLTCIATNVSFCHWDHASDEHLCAIQQQCDTQILQHHISLPNTIDMP